MSFSNESETAATRFQSLHGRTYEQHMGLSNGTAHNGTALHQPPSMPYALAIFYAILLVMIAAQSGLFLWKKRHKRSYELVTLLGLWLFPAMISFHLKFYRFVVVWALYTSMTAYLLSLCILPKKIDRSTPRKVYTWFLAAHKVSVALGVAGYALLVLEMLGVGLLLRPFISPTFSILLLWYGLYFGILGRDCAEVAGDRMVHMMGTGRRLAVSVKDCGICGGELPAVDFVNPGQGDPATGEKAVQLGCKHLFHGQCIRGWTIVGKKDTCPVCLEKVDLRSLYADRPWETSNLSWVQMLDAIRYMVVWNPIIFTALHFILHVFGVDEANDPFDPQFGQNATMAFNGTANSTFGGAGQFQLGGSHNRSLTL